MTEENLSLLIDLIPLELMNTIYMVVVSSFFAVFIGLPLGIVLYLTGKGGIKDSPYLYKTLSSITNVGRSFPFAILMIALIPFTKWLIGTSLGNTAAIVPLSIAAAPFLARLVESALKEIDKALIDTAKLMGARTHQIIGKVLLAESLPSLLSVLTSTMINLIGYSAMAGLVGGGGLGRVAIQYGYYRFNTCIMLATVALLIVLVECVQWLGNFSSHAILQKRGKISYE